MKINDDRICVEKAETGSSVLITDMKGIVVKRIKNITTGTVCIDIPFGGFYVMIYYDLENQQKEKLKFTLK